MGAGGINRAKDAMHRHRIGGSAGIARHPYGEKPARKPACATFRQIKIAIAAGKAGATAFGIEYNPDMAKLAQCFVRADGVGNKVKIIQGDIFKEDFSKATVVTMYLLPELNLRLRPTLGDIVVVSPDVGGVVRARAFAKRMECDLAIIDKRRPKANVSEVMNIIGEVEGRTGITPYAWWVARLGLWPYGLTAAAVLAVVFCSA